ncbi:hypothetical protein K4K55_001365, partial [Colletotrichum sp. SAR 10_96]
FSFIGYIFTLPFPDQLLASGKRAAFTQREIETILDRVERDRGDAEPDPLTWQKFTKLVIRWELWVYGFMFLCCSAPIYAFAYFIQIILTTLGYSTAVVFLLCAPPYLFSIIWTLLVAYVADKTRLRMPWMVLNAAITLTGLLLTAYHSNNGVRYFGVFLGVSGCNGNLPTIIAFQSNNVRSNSRRSVASGVQMLFAAIGGIFASCTFMQQEYPMYRTVPCLVCPQMDKFYIPWGGSTVEAVRGAFCDLLLALQNPRPADTMLLSCVQNITLRHIHYFNKEYGPSIEVLAAFPRLRSIQVILTAEDPRSVAPYSPSSRTFEPLPESHSHDKLEHIKCETPLDPDGLSYWSKTQGHDFYELSRVLGEKIVKIWLATSLRAEPWAELVASPDGPRLAYKTNPCICKTWAPHHMAFRYFFHYSYDLRSPQCGFFQKGFYPLGPGGKPVAKGGRRGTFLVPKTMTSIRERSLKPRGQ